MTPNLPQIRAALYANSFKDFVKAFWPYVSNDPFKGGYLVDAITYHLEALHKGEIKRLVIACPIRHGKSLLCSVLWPAWVWLKDPTIRILSASCGEDLAQRDSVRSRNLIECPLYQKLFPNVRLSDDQNQKQLYITDRGGQRKAVGVNTKSTGLDADYLIVDDLLDYQRARSEAERTSGIDFFTKILSKRLVHGTGKDRILIAGHRVHEEDLFNEIRTVFGDDGEYTYLVLPAEARPTYTNSLYNGLNWKDTRQEGELLWPERYSKKVLDGEKRSLRHEYHCLYQQDPTPATGDQFKATWFKYHTTEDNSYVLENNRYIKTTAWRFGTIDTAISEESGADFTVCQIWDVVGDKLVLVHQLRKRLNGAMMVPTLHEVWNTYKPQFFSIEQEFVGKFVIDQLRALNVVVKPFHAKKYGPKQVRAVSAEIRLEAGKVYFPQGVDWVADLEREILGFPHSAHDDQVDALSMACLLADRFLGQVEPDLSPQEKQEKLKREREQWFKNAMEAGSLF